MHYIIFLLALLITNVANAIDCDVAPTCEELGYSRDDDPYCADNGYMYCPLDHTYKKCVNMDCAKMGFTEDDKTLWCGKLAKCKGNAKMTLCQNLCEIGDVYYSDGTCGYVEDYDASLGKIPVGVVYYVTDNGRHGKVINLHDLGKKSEYSVFDPQNPYDTGYSHLSWGYEKYKIPNLTIWNCSTHHYKIAAQSKNHSDPFWSAGREYTEIIAKALKDDLKYAAPAARAFYPLKVSANHPIVGQGKWYLPTLGELMDLYGYDYSNLSEVCDTATGARGKTKQAVNNTLIALKNKNVIAEKLSDKYSTDSAYYWTSSEYDETYVWLLTPDTGLRSHLRLKHQGAKVRVSLEF